MPKACLLVVSSILLASLLAACVEGGLVEDEPEPTPPPTRTPTTEPDPTTEPSPTEPDATEPAPTPEADVAEPTRPPRTPLARTLQPPAESTRLATGTNAMVQDLQISIIESDPVQVYALVSGFVPDGCTEVVEHRVQFDGTTFTITLITHRPAGAMCTMALEPFTRTVPLDVEGLEPGEYAVRAGDLTASFRLGGPAGEGQPSPADSGDATTGLATVRSVEVVGGAGSTSPEIAIRGFLSDACTELGAIYDRPSPQDANTVLVTVESTRVQQALCAQVVKAFDVTHTITSIPGPGEYVIDVNGVTIEYTAR